jgi:hypothetical protein
VQAFAALGGHADSVESDRVSLSARRGATTVQNGYTVHVIAYGGATVREYVSLAGIVFAVTWEGVVHPDLTALLGKYAGRYRKALSDTPRHLGAKRLTVQGDGVVVEKWGHVRDLQGRAYAPDLIPPGVGVDEIR